MDTIYNFTVKKTDGTLQSLEDYKGQTILIVNTLGFPSDNFNNQEFVDIEETMSFVKSTMA